MNKRLQYLILTALLAGVFIAAILCYRFADFRLLAVAIAVGAALCWYILKGAAQKKEIAVLPFNAVPKPPVIVEKEQEAEVSAELPAKRLAEISVYQVIDLRQLIILSKGNREAEKSMTAQFIQTVSLELAALHQKYEEGDIFGINQVAHDLKSTVAIMGLLPKLEDELDQLDYVKSDALEIPELIDAVTVVCAAALEEAELFYQSLLEA